ncbi:MAG: TetR family transcriptional regulator [Desulforudis sp.]|nr:MAG: TetR family transcriptional regulator [Desulforudis sp.]
MAERAGVGIALVNYHFQSKDNLIEQAIGIKMKAITDEMYDLKNASDDPVEKLRSMIKQIAELSIRYRFLI